MISDTGKQQANIRAEKLPVGRPPGARNRRSVARELRAAIGDLLIEALAVEVARGDAADRHQVVRLTEALLELRS